MYSLFLFYRCCLGRVENQSVFLSVHYQSRSNARIQFDLEFTTYWLVYFCCGCPLPGRIQSQIGWGSTQPDLVKDVPAHDRGLDWIIIN